MTIRQKYRLEQFLASVTVSAAGLLFASPFLILAGGLISQ